MNGYIHVEDAAVLLDNILTREYLIHRIEGGEFIGKRVKERYYISKETFEWLKRILLKKDYSDVREIEKNIDEVDFNKIKIKGSIIDIGGGGEGISGRRYGKMVVSIDKSLRELLETKNDSIKIVSDGMRLPFKEKTFDNSTAFFAFMYMPVKTRKIVMAEIHRVLRERGMLYVFEPKISSAHYRPMTLLSVYLTVKAGKEKIHTGYGAVLAKSAQSRTHFTAIAKENGFVLEEHFDFKDHFILVFAKA